MTSKERGRAKGTETIVSMKAGYNDHFKRPKAATGEEYIWLGIECEGHSKIEPFYVRFTI
jgi:hypothetical protein